MDRRHFRSLPASCYVVRSDSANGPLLDHSVGARNSIGPAQENAPPPLSQWLAHRPPATSDRQGLLKDGSVATKRPWRTGGPPEISSKKQPYCIRLPLLTFRSETSRKRSITHVGAAGCAGIEDTLAEAGALDSIGQVYEAFGDKRKAVEFYNRALPLARAAGDREARATR